MLNITVKTLDSQNHIFSVPDDLSVRNFKERIAGSVGIPPDKQRLIYCGRVLQDDKKLGEYDADGKVIHLVQRPPPPTSSGRATSSSGSGTSEASTNSSPQGQAPHPGFVHRIGGQDGNSFLLGAFTIPSDAMDTNHVQQIVQQVVSGMGELGRNATVMSRTSDDGSTVDVHINLGQVPLQGDAQNRISLMLNMLRRAHNCVSRLENPNSANNVNEEAQNEENSRSEQGSASSDLPAQTSDPDVSRQPPADAASTTESAEIPLRPTIIGGGFASIADAARMAATAAFAAASSAARATGFSSGGFSSSSRLPSQSSQNEQQQPQQERPPQQESGSGTASAAAGVRGVPSNAPAQHVTHPPALVTALMELQGLQTRLQPFLNQYLDCLREDRNFQGNSEEQSRAQALFNGVSTVMHYISHAYHAASDIMIDMAQAPPRSLRCRPIIMQQPAVIQAGVPVQAHINVSTTLNAARAASQNNSSGNATGATGNAASPTSSSTLPSNGSTESSAANPPPAGSEQASPNTPLIGPLPSSVASLFSPSNPFVVMELGPSSITIDSISAVTSESGGSQPANNQGFRFPEVVVQQAPSQDLIQNLMQAVGQSASYRFGVNGQSQARGNTATHPTTSTQTRSTSRPIQTIPLAIPGFSFANFDPYLPCSSRHIAGLHRPVVSVRNMQQSQQQQSSTGGPTAPLDAQLAGMVANMMSAFFSNPGNAANVVGSAPPPPPPPRSSSTRPAAPLGIPRILVDFMSQWRQAAGEASQYSTIADFLRTLPDFNYQEGEGLLSDMIMCIARHLSLRELIEVMFGRTDALNRLQSHLRTFMRTRVLRDREPTETNISAAVNEIVTALEGELRAVRGDIEVRDGIDYLATMRNFCEKNLLSLITLILSSEEGDFGSALYALCRRIISEDIGLNMHCFRNGQQAVEYMVQNRVRQVASDLDPFTRQWMSSWCTAQIRTMIPNINVQESDILRYVIRNEERSPPSEQGTSRMPETQESPTVQSEENRVSPMEVDTPSSDSAESERTSALTGGAEGAVAGHLVSETDVVSNLLASAPAWTSAVAADWVPVITEDIERQRRQSTQRPFSEAYLGMVSSKRRKVMSNGRLQAVVDATNILPDTIRRAVSASGVHPTTSMNDLIQDVTANASLNSAFENHLRQAISRRLNEDKDYQPEKFPNAENMFRGKHNNGENV